MLKTGLEMLLSIIGIKYLVGMRFPLFVGLTFLCCMMVQIPCMASGSQYMEVADQLLKDKKYVEAAGNYEQALKAFEEAGDVENILQASYHLAKCKTHAMDFEGSLKAFEQMERRAKEHGKNQMQAAALDAQISILNHYTRNEETEKKCHELLALEDVSEDLYSNAHLILGHILSMQGKNQEGFERYLKAYKIDSIRQDSSSLPFLLSIMGNNLRGQGNYSLALDYMLQATSWIRMQDSFKLSDVYCDLGIVFLEMHNSVIAKEYFDQARYIADKFKLKSQAHELNYYEGQNMLTQEMGDLAEEKFKQAANGFLKRKNDPWLFKCFNSLTIINIEKSDFKTAERYLEKADSLSNLLGRGDLDIGLMNNYTSFYLAQNDLIKTKIYLQKALETVEEIKQIGIKSRTYNLANKYYHLIGDDRRAYEYRNKFDVLKDSINALQRSSLVYEMEAKYKKTQQDLAIAELDLLNKEKSQQLFRQNRTILLGGIGLVGLAGLGVLGFSLYRTKQRAAKKLEEKNQIISQSLSDKELLLKEIHHRVKNNLQVISSLLSLQSDYITDDTALSAIQEGRNRVKSMAIIHQNLYQEDNLTGIQVKMYFEKLTRSLFNSYNIKPGQIDLALNVEAINLDVDTVIPLGLIVNELITNSLKYAFPSNQPGKIFISLTESSNVLSLIVEDDGIGFDSSSLDEESSSFGYQIIHAFKDKLEADLNIDSVNGTKVQLNIGAYQKAS